VPIASSICFFDRALSSSDDGISFGSTHAKKREVIRRKRVETPDVLERYEPC
jgi:hypothetical protein